jgi:phenylpropionate dioxygenase-like ring-hydroxylating dioxygenase large terminal subunit
VTQFNSKTILPCFPTSIHSGILFVYPNASGTDDVPFFPPEEYDSGYRSISGTRIINQNYKIVVENLLDMLHISYVHSFGSFNTPLPSGIRYTDISDISGRTTFEYSPNDDTISTRVGNVVRVRVQNEFHLPTNTVTRVVAGRIIKTVFTRCLPVKNNETLLFWKVYRNFWIDPYWTIFSRIGDWLIRVLMERTIDEDASILQYVYRNQTSILRTKYDITIQKYREKLHTFKHRLSDAVLPLGLAIVHHSVSLEGSVDDTKGS